MEERRAQEKIPGSELRRTAPWIHTMDVLPGSRSTMALPGSSLERGFGTRWVPVLWGPHFRHATASQELLGSLEWPCQLGRAGRGSGAVGCARGSWAHTGSSPPESSSQHLLPTARGGNVFCVKTHRPNVWMLQVFGQATSKRCSRNSTSLFTV